MSSLKKYREKFVQAIKIALAQKGWTQLQLAQRINITPQYISALMVGKRNPKEELQIKIAQALDYDLDDFIKLNEKDGNFSAPEISPDREKELLKKIESLSDLVVNLKRQLKEADDAPEARAKKIIRELRALKKEIELLKKGSSNFSAALAVLGGELAKKRGE